MNTFPENVPWWVWLILALIGFGNEDVRAYTICAVMATLLSFGGYAVFKHVTKKPEQSSYVE